MKSNTDSDKNADILISALEERYNSTHKIRERVQNICVWSLGLLVAASGWLVQSKAHFSLSHTLLIAGGVFVAYWALRYRYFKDLETGFKNQMQTTARIEKTLGFYTPGFFTEEKEALYPEKWLNSGTETGNGNYFRRSYELILVGLVLFYVALLVKTCI